MINVAIVGVTSWGITLADLLAKNGLNVTICARNKEDVEDFTNKRLKIFSSNNLKKFQEINITTEYYENLKNADMVLISVPSKSFRKNIQNIKQYLSGSALLISATKGLEINTSMRMSQILYDELKDNQYRGISVLSGPNLAAEIIQEIPSSTVIASDNKRITLEVRKFFSSKFFHVYTSSDVIGVEFGGALKNIIAIGVGICYGLKYGNNTVATFITSGFNEMIKHEEEVINYAYQRMSELPDMKFIGTDERSAVISFNIGDIHHQDMAMFLDTYGIATRPGHHCTQMLHRQIGWTGSCRISTGVYSTKQEVDYFIDCLKEIYKRFN